MSTDGIITCPNEYGPPIGEVKGVFRSLFGECICDAHGETPCRYLDRKAKQSVVESQLSPPLAEDKTP